MNRHGPSRVVIGSLADRFRQIEEQKHHLGHQPRKSCIDGIKKNYKHRCLSFTWKMDIVAGSYHERQRLWRLYAARLWWCPSGRTTCEPDDAAALGARPSATLRLPTCQWAVAAHAHTGQGQCWPARQGRALGAGTGGRKAPAAWHVRSSLRALGRAPPLPQENK